MKNLRILAGLVMGLLAGCEDTTFRAQPVDDQVIRTWESTCSATTAERPRDWCSGRSTADVDVRGASIQDNRIEFVFDSEGREIRQRNDIDTDGTIDIVVRMTYRDDGRLESQTVELAERPDVTLRYSYDADGRRTRCDESSGLGAPSVSVEYLYDEQGVHVSSELHRAADGYTQFAELGYDEDGHLEWLEQRDDDGSLMAWHTYETDALGRIIRSESQDDRGLTTKEIDYSCHGEQTRSGDTEVAEADEHSSPVTGEGPVEVMCTDEDFAAIGNAIVDLATTRPTTVDAGLRARLEPQYYCLALIAAPIQRRLQAGGTQIYGPQELQAPLIQGLNLAYDIPALALMLSGRLSAFEVHERYQIGFVRTHSSVPYLKQGVELIVSVQGLIDTAPAYSTGQGYPSFLDYPIL